MVVCSNVTWHLCATILETVASQSASFLTPRLVNLIQLLKLLKKFVTMIPNQLLKLLNLFVLANLSGVIMDMHELHEE